MLVGREAELRELLAAAAYARASGRGWTALIGGEAGIGKTRLAAEFADRLRADGFAVAWAACRQDGGAPPFWPWRQLLDRLGRRDALAAPSAIDPDLARFQLFEAVANALRAAAPVLLVLDDLHWSDEPSLRLLDALGAHIGAAAVLVLGTFRDTESDSAAVAAIATIVAERRLTLRGLSAADLGPALTDVTGETITPDIAAALYRRTAGNPFFAAEVVRLLRADGNLHSDGGHPLPGSVRVVLDRRIDRLPEPAETLLRAAAALDAGTTTGVDTVLLAAVAGCAPAELATLLEPVVDARLVRADAGRYCFPHALVADTLSARTPPAQRLELHRKAGAALVARVATGLGDPADAAHHLLAAARISGDPDEARAAATACAGTARTALRRTAYEDAVGWLEAGLAVLANASHQSGRGPDRGDLLCALGEAALAAGDRARSRKAFAEAAEHARRQGGRPEVLAAAALGTSGGAAGFEVDLVDPDRTALLVEALDALPDTDSAMRSTVSARLSIALAFTGAEQRRQGLAEDAVAMARRIDDPHALAAALAARCEALAGPDHVALRRDAAQEMIACTHRARDPVGELLGRRLRLMALAEAGDWAAVDGEIDTYARVVEPLRQPGLTWYVPLWRGTRAAMRGDEAAEAVQSTELHRQVQLSGSTNAEILALSQHFVREVNAGRPAEILPTIGLFVQLAPDEPATTYCAIGLLRAMSGESIEAAQLLDAYLAARADGTRDSEWLPEMVQAAMTAVLIDDRRAAATVYDRMAPYVGLFAIEGIAAGTWGCVDAHLGRLARLLGRAGDAERHFAVALELNAAAGSALLERTRRWAACRAPTHAPVGSATEGTFRRDGEVWTLAYGGRTVRLHDTKGLRDIAALLARPGRDLAVQELVGASAAAADASFELADRTAIDAYRRRLIDLEEQRAEAEAMHDPVRGEKAAAERDALVDELAAVTGLGGRVRRVGSDSERMRKAVGNRIRQALGRIEALHPELGRHLRVSVRTGTFCRYDPHPEVRWRM